MKVHFSHPSFLVLTELYVSIDCVYHIREENETEDTQRGHKYLPLHRIRAQLSVANSQLSSTGDPYTLAYVVEARFFQLLLKHTH